ncbi:hypothetical protein Tco_1221711, partial [Tanacetum coccineum]
HILLMQNGIAIHMLTEKKYPLSQEMLSKMLSKRLEVDHESTQAYELLKFIRSQGRIVGNKSSSRVNTAKITLKFPNQEFVEPPPHDELVSFVEQLGYIELIWEDFQFHIESRQTSDKKIEHMTYPRFTKFVNKGEEHQKYGMSIPGSMMNDAIRNSAHYLTYLALSTNIETEKKKDTVPRKKRSFTAADNILPNLDEAVKLAELIKVEVLSSNDERTETDGFKKAGNEKADEEKADDETAAEEKTRDEKAEDEKVEEEKAKDKKAVEEKVIEEQAGDEQIRVIENPLVDKIVTMFPKKTSHSLKQQPQQSKSKINIKKHKKPEEKVDVDVVLKRLVKLKKKVEAMSKVDHTKTINKSFQAHLKKVLPKDVPDFGKVKQEKTAKKNMPRYSTKSFNDDSVKEYDMKQALLS